jgi:serine/threonine protein kinase
VSPIDPILPFDDPDALVGRVLPSGLRVLKRLGPTTIGPLYRAQYPSGPPVALTLLDPPLRPRDPSTVFSPSPRSAQWFRRACELRHPNVASLLEVGETSDGLTYVVGEFLTGELLSDVLAARGALPLEEAVDICLQVAAGLQEAHRIGIVHGNVSPRTILIAQSEGDRRLAKLIRFNLDWEAEAGRGPPGGVDVPYTSPERLAGSAPEELGDVYSLGGVLHHLLSGAPPGGPLARTSIPMALWLVVDRALAPAPDTRYATVAAFAEALASAGKFAGKPRRARSRHPRLPGATIGVVVLAAVIWFGWSRHWIEGASDRTDRETAMRVGDEVGLARTRPAPLDPAPPARTGTDPASVRPSVKRPERQPPPSPVPGAPAKVTPRSTPAASPVVTGNVPSSKREAAGSKGSARERARADPAPQAAISPFRRAHPWAALPEGRFYFPSSCPLALRSRELLYFASETEARATGRSRSTQPGCS